MHNFDKTGLCHHEKHTTTERNVVDQLCEAFETSTLPVGRRLQNFPRHVRRQDIARLLVKYEIFKQAIHVMGNIVECGVLDGCGLFTWMHLSAIFEPYNHTRRIIGFDTFAGFQSLTDEDLQTGKSEHLGKGGILSSENALPEIENLISIHDKNRPLGHIPKIELVKGDACTSIPAYLKENPHTLISILYLDFDIFKPTKVALEYFYPRVVRGGLVVFDALNSKDFPGESLALLELLDLKDAKVKRFSFDSCLSYFIKGEE